MAGFVFLVNRDSPIGAGAGRTVGSTAVNGVPVVEWPALRGLNIHNGKPSAEIEKLNGTKIRVPGYIVPLDDDSRTMTEFLLVPYVGACVHTPPPPANQMIYVKMTRGEKADFGLMDGVWVEGTLFVGRRSSPYGPTYYAMTANRVERYQ